MKVACIIIFFIFMYGAGVEPSPLLLQPFIGLLYQPWLIDGDDCRAISGINEWQGKLKYSEKSAPVLLYPPQIPHDLILVRTQAITVESQQLTA
jgi:hypothetical protein